MIFIDTVYQTVQALANKEQRGYITPQEFNLFANQAQSDMFEQYLYDLAAVKDARPEQRQLGDSIRQVLFKIDNTDGVSINPNAPVTGGTTLPKAGGRMRHTGRIFVSDTTGRRTARRIENIDEIYDLRGSPWHKEAFDEVLYFEDGVDQIQVHTGTGQITTGVTCEAINIPVAGLPIVAWGYNIVNEKAVYNPMPTRNFSLHISEQADLVIKILKLAGISTEDQQLFQAAAVEDNSNTQQENK
tara:strand:- start:4775 stop:5506 length:732 start_codon:yes stop_codon:yes gene_type:complete